LKHWNIGTMRRYRIPKLRYWRFNDEEWSPLELYVRDKFRLWAESEPWGREDKRRRKQVMWELRRIAKEYGVKINDIWNWKLAVKTRLSNYFRRFR